MDVMEVQSGGLSVLFPVGEASDSIRSPFVLQEVCWTRVSRDDNSKTPRDLQQL